MGAGSQAAQISALQELSPFVGGFTEKEARAYKRDVIIATVGRESLSRYQNESSVPDEMAGGSSLAGVENAIMQAGKSPVFSLENDHRAHAATHFALAQQIVQANQQQQMSPIEADSVFAVLVPHLADHMQALQQDILSQGFFQKLKPSFDQLSKYAQLNRRNAIAQVKSQQKQQMQMQEQTQEVMTEEQLKTMQALNDEQRKDMKLAAQQERQQKAGEAKEIALRKKTDSDIENKRKKTDAEVQATRIKAELANNADEKVAENAGEVLTEMAGNTISPFDIEGL